MLNREEIKNRNILIVCSGSTVVDYKDKIVSFINKYNILTIGCNNITHILTPDFHIFADFQRYQEFGNMIKESSTPIFPTRFSDDFIKEHWAGEYIRFDCKYDKNRKLQIENGVPRCHFKTVGLLAVVFSYLSQASNIYIVGMDGYSLYGQTELDSGLKSQHCYGSGHTDRRHIYKNQKVPKSVFGKEYKMAVRKDRVIYKLLKHTRGAGITFSIITPTKYSQFYKPDILGNIKL